MNAPWTRPELPVRAPDRGVGGLLRSADRQQAGQVIAGVPMQTVSDAVVATVRLGYQVADRQIERGKRLTEQLRGAAARAGVDDPEVWIEQTERLLAKALMAGSGLADGALGTDSVLMRLARAELKLLARWAGLKIDGAADKPAGPAADAPAPAAPAPKAAAAPAVAVRLAAADPADRRAVQVLQAQWSTLPAEALPLWFHLRGGTAAEPMAGTLERVDGHDRLSLHTLRQQPAGVWRAAVCLADGLQIGSVDVEL
jgi:hypothetical protein